MTEEPTDNGLLDAGQDARTTVQDLVALLGVVELSAVRFVEVSGKRLLDGSREGSETTFDMQFLHKVERDHVGLRFRMLTQSADADYVVDVETIYTLAQEVEIPPVVLEEFVERTGVMAAFPYIREGLASLAIRLGAEVPLLALLRAGQFHVEIPDTRQKAVQPPAADENNQPVT